MPKKTNTRDRIYKYLKEYIEENGKSPSIEEIRKHLMLAGTGTIYNHIERLEKDGLVEIGRVRNMKKFSKITVKEAKMRNLDAFNAMSREGQRNALIEYFKKWANIGECYIHDLVVDIKNESDGYIDVDDFKEWDYARICELSDEFLDWLYSQAEMRLQSEN